MRFSEAKAGRVFVMSLDHGEVLHETIERFAAKQGVSAASVVLVGGADRESRLVVGPENGDERPVNPMEHELDDVHEVFGTGTLFPDEEGKPVLHMHVACGRKASAVCGCVRRGVKIWVVGEVILQEIVGSSAVRRTNPKTGFKLLDP